MICQSSPDQSKSTMTCKAQHHHPRQQSAAFHSACLSKLVLANLLKLNLQIMPLSSSSCCASSISQHSPAVTMGTPFHQQQSKKCKQAMAKRGNPILMQPSNLSSNDHSQTTAKKKQACFYHGKKKQTNKPPRNHGSPRSPHSADNERREGQHPAPVELLGD